MARKKRPQQPDPGRGNGQDRRVPDSDYLLKAARENWPSILMMYRLHEDNKPVVLLDIPEQKVSVYSYSGFKEEFSERSQQSLKDQYESAVRENKVVVFVRDNDKRRLVAFSMDLE